MFTSLRARLWLSYALVTAIALSIVTMVLFIFLIRNPVLSRQTQERLKAALSLIVASPQDFINDPDALERIKQTYDVRVMVFDGARELLLQRIGAFQVG